MFRIIYNFEIRQQSKRPFIWVVCLLMFIQGLYYMHHSGEFYATDETYANASAIFFTVFAGIGYVGFIVASIIGGTVITKDLQSKFSSILFTTSASESGYFWGRYWSGFSILLALNMFYLLGAFSYSFLPIANMGPINLTSLFAAVLYILIPNTFILYTFCFCAASLTKNIKSSYLASMFIMLIMIFSVSMHDSSRSVALYDPTSFGVLLDELEHMSPDEKNNYLPALTGVLTWNRLGWLTLALVTLWLSRLKFSFKLFSRAVSAKKTKIIHSEVRFQTLNISNNSESRKKLTFSTLNNWKNVFSLSLTELKSVIAPSGFKIFMGLLMVMYICYIAVWQQQYYSVAPTLPVTVEITNVTIALSFYFQLFIIINTVELLFRNQTSEFWKIADALPVPSWVTTLSKINAMLIISILLSVCLIIFGIMVQMFKGYFHFELSVYFNEIILRWLPKYAAYIFLCVAIAGITGSKFVTHGLTILVLVFTVVLHEIGVFEQNRFAFTFSPGALKYTDMNGAGIFGLANFWYSIYWLSLSLALAFFALIVWPRGLASPLRKRFKLGGSANIMLAGFFISAGLFIYSSVYINNTVNVVNQFSTLDEDRISAVNYEKKYKRFELLPQPEIKHISFDMNIFPEQRSYSYSATLNLYNSYNKPIETLHMEWADFMQIDKLDVEGNRLKLVSEDKDLRHRVYRIETPLQAGQSLKLNIAAQKKYKGFTNDDPQIDIVHNGSFISEDFLPFIGAYDNRRELDDNRQRKAYKINPIISVLPSADSELARRFSSASVQSGGFTFDGRVSTPLDQSLVMPGILEREWQESGRHHYEFKSEKIEPFQISLLSAKYKKQQKNIVVGGKTIDIEVYYHTDHAYNVPAWLESGEEALKFLHHHLGNYPYSKLIIAERPRYDNRLIASGNLIILPENHGWIADVRKKEDKDYLRFITTQLVGEQYFSQCKLTRAQGYPFLTKSIPAYLALVQMENLFGRESVDNYMKKNHDKYLAGKSLSGLKELPLLKCDETQDYIFNHRGVEVLFKTGNQLIEQSVFLQQIQLFYQKSVNSHKMFSAMDWYNDAIKMVPEDKRLMFQQMFLKTQ